MSSLNCYSRHKLKRIEPTDKWVNKTIEVEAKDGHKFKLVSYIITSEKIVGKDESWKEYEIMIDDIQNVVVVHKLTKNQQVPIAFFALFATGFLVLYLSLKSLEGTGIGI